MRADSKNIQEFEDLILHDAELIDINCNYRDHIVNISARLNLPRQRYENNQVINLAFKEFSYFSISCEEPWGNGFYIFDAEVQQTDDTLESQDGKIKFKITLDSGDEINISSSWVEWLLS